jgi:hypothetical protein
MAISPTAEGFRAAFRRPSLALAEIMWRWIVGATAAAICVFGFLEYLDTLPVTNGELLFLRTRHPYLVGEAIAHILRGSLNRAVLAALLAALMLCILWMLAASLGRIATVRALLDYFHRDAARYNTGGDVSHVDRRGSAGQVSAKESREDNSFTALLRLNFLRVATAVAALVGLLGAAILAGFASPDANPRPGLAFSLFLPLAGFICWLWWAFNWLLSVAGVFAVRDGEDVVGAISAAVALLRERTGAILAVTTWTGLAHLVVFVAASTVASMPLGFAGLVPWRVLLAVQMVVALGYFASVDWFYMARLAGYVCIAEMPQALLPPLPPMPLRPTPPLQTSIDRDELILSDLPNLAIET